MWLLQVNKVTDQAKIETTSVSTLPARWEFFFLMMMPSGFETCDIYLHWSSDALQHGIVLNLFLLFVMLCMQESFDCSLAERLF